MAGFSASFLIFFWQVALGGLFALAATPFNELDRAFYKSTAGVLLVVGLLGFWGKSYLYWNDFSRHASIATIIEAGLHLCFVAGLAIYVFSLWTENRRLISRAFSFALLTGLAGLALSARAFYDAPLLSVETIVYPVNFLLSALLLGTATVGMLIGHWYLIDTGQTLDPFIRVYKFFVAALLVQCGFFIISALLLYAAGAPDTEAALNRLWADHSTLVTIRVIAGDIAPIVLAWMIWRTLLIPHTMAATGLFYIALLGVFVGEILGRQILALTSLPF